METEAELIGLINANSLSAGSPLKLSLQPAPDQPAMTSYSLTAGRTYTFALVAANSAGEEPCLRALLLDAPIQHRTLH